MGSSHLLTLVTFSLLVSIFFATLTRETAKEAFRLGAGMFGLMVGISLAVGWLMYLFPLG